MVLIGSHFDIMSANLNWTLRENSSPNKGIAHEVYTMHQMYNNPVIYCEDRWLQRQNKNQLISYEWFTFWYFLEKKRIFAFKMAEAYLSRDIASVATIFHLL